MLKGSRCCSQGERPLDEVEADVTGVDDDETRNICSGFIDHGGG